MDKIDKYVPDFSSYILSKSLINFEDYFFLISEENTKIQANPFISVLIAFYLKNNMNVILVSNYESLHHYSSIAKKFVKFNNI
jgi:hypothetical protein